jgi:TusA-related sulfurtransferase
MTSLFSFPAEGAATSPIRHEPNAMVDLTGLTCPGPILGAKEILEGLKDGQVLLLLSDCPGTRDDLFAWARQTGNEVIYTESREDGATAYYLRRGRADAVAAHVRLDLRGVVCPGPIVEAKQLLKGMRPGEVLKLVSDCPGVRDDIVGWTKATGIDLVTIHETGAGVHEFFLRKH